MPQRLMATMVTTTTYGSWLPGDLRGYVENGIILPGDPAVFSQAIQSMGARTPIRLSSEQQSIVFDALCDACTEFGYKLTDASVESWHAHWIVQHGFDPVADMVGRLKNRMRQALKVGRIWTAGYYDSLLFDEPAVQARRIYVRRHAGCRLSNGIPIH